MLKADQVSLGGNKCSLCNAYFYKDGMIIKTEVDERTFCIKCIKWAFDNLQRKKDKQPDEIALMMGIRKFLSERNKNAKEKN